MAAAVAASAVWGPRACTPVRRQTLATASPRKAIREMAQALEAHKIKVRNNQDAVEEDFMFHLKIADASKNTVMKSLMLIITPDIMQYFKTHDVCGEGRSDVAVEQHEMLLQQIIDRKPEPAQQSLMQHLHEISEYVRTLKQGMRLNGDGLLI